MPLLRRLDASPSLLWLWFNSRLVHVRIVVDNVETLRVFSEYFSFSRQCSYHLMLYFFRVTSKASIMGPPAATVSRDWLRWPQSHSGHSGEETSIFTLLEIELRLLGRPACSPVCVPNEPSRAEETGIETAP
jgi:hypothetical protein